MQVFSSIYEITPAAPFAQALSIFEKFVSIFLGFILVAALFSERSDKVRRELDKTISDIERDGSAMSEFVVSEYQLGSFDEALEELDKVEAGLWKLFVFLGNKFPAR